MNRLMVGRVTGLSAQQFCINSHIDSVKPQSVQEGLERCGRRGRFPQET